MAVGVPQTGMEFGPPAAPFPAAYGIPFSGTEDRRIRGKLRWAKVPGADPESDRGSVAGGRQLATRIEGVRMRG